MAPTVTKPDALHYTGDPDADRLLAQEPMALLIGFALDQQVPVQTAFSGPLKLKRRLGTLEAKALAQMDPGELEQACREKPAVHRFPGTMARRVQELASVVADEYGGDAARIWRDADDAQDLRRRGGAGPGAEPSDVWRRRLPTRVGGVPGEEARLQGVAASQAALKPLRVVAYVTRGDELPMFEQRDVPPA